MDCAASEFCFKGEDGKFYYDYKQLKDGKKKDPRGRKLSTDQQINYLKQLITKYPIDSIEDGLSEEDWEGWVKLTKAIGDRCQLVTLDCAGIEARRQGRSLYGTKKPKSEE